MSVEVDMDKKRFTEAEARYLVDRPWLTSQNQRKGLLRMLAKKDEKAGDQENQTQE